MILWVGQHLMAAFAVGAAAMLMETVESHQKMPSVPFKSIWGFVPQHVAHVKTSAVMLLVMASVLQQMHYASSRNTWGLDVSTVTKTTMITKKFYKKFRR